MPRRDLEVSCPYILLDEAGAPRWRQETVRSAADMERVIQAITAAITEAGYPEKEVFAVHLAMEEAIVNAHKHGHQGDWSQPIVVRYQLGAKGVVVQVEDQGPGFDPEQVPDPLDPANLERPCGRGLLLMRHYLHGVCHNERGNHLCLCKHHAEPRPRE